MTLTKLPNALRKEIEDLRGPFDLRPNVLLDDVTLLARVRGVPVEIHLDVDTYPAAPPRMTLGEGWSWHSISGFGRHRDLRGLNSQARWNRTLGLGVLLRELERLFNETPPVPREPGLLRRRRMRRRERGRSVLGSLLVRWRVLWSRLTGRRKPRASQTTVRSHYDKLIEEKSTYIARYREALSKLEEQWGQRTAKIRQQQERIEQLTRQRERSLKKAGRVVEELRASGRPEAAIKSAKAYRTGMATYRNYSLALEEEQARLRELEHEAEELRQKLREHTMRLDIQVQELEELREEAHNVETELALTEVEQELLDIRTGTSRSDLAGQRETMLASLRTRRAELKVSKQIAGVESQDDDLEYLRRGQEAAAVREYEARLGLGEASPVVDETRVAE